jgi:hypothetical protein
MKVEMQRDIEQVDAAIRSMKIFFFVSMSDCQYSPIR